MSKEQSNEIRFRIWPELELKIEKLKSDMAMGSDKELVVFLINKAYTESLKEKKK